MITQKELTKEEYIKFSRWALSHDWHLIKNEQYTTNKRFYCWLAPNGETHRCGVETP